MIRKATIDDIEYIDEIYSKILDEEEQGKRSIGWIRGVYPTKQTALDALKRDDLFVEAVDGKIVATAIINKIQQPEYSNCKWQYQVDDLEVMVLHTLIVNPTESGKGYARKFVNFYEDYALSKNCHYLRMDTQVKNNVARAMYAKLGFNEVGVIDCIFNGIKDVKLVCLEKKI